MQPLSPEASIPVLPAYTPFSVSVNFFSSLMGNLQQLLLKCMGMTAFGAAAETILSAMSVSMVKKPPTGMSRMSAPFMNASWSSAGKCPRSPRWTTVTPSETNLKRRFLPLFAPPQSSWKLAADEIWKPAITVSQTVSRMVSHLMSPGKS